MRLLPTIYFTFGSVYMSMPLSHFVQSYTSPPCVLKSILYVCVFIPVVPLGSSEHFFFFRLHIYVLAYGIGFSLSDLLHSVWQTLGPPTSLQITQFHFFLWLSNIALYICATSSLSIHLSISVFTNLSILDSSRSRVLLCLICLLSIIFSRFILLQHASEHFFLWLNNISLHMYATFCLPFICWWTLWLFPRFDNCE